MTRAERMTTEAARIQTDALGTDPAARQLCGWSMRAAVALLLAHGGCAGEAEPCAATPRALVPTSSGAPPADISLPDRTLQYEPGPDPCELAEPNPARLLARRFAIALIERRSSELKAMVHSTRGLRIQWAPPIAWKDVDLLLSDRRQLRGWCSSADHRVVEAPAANLLSALLREEDPKWEGPSDAAVPADKGKTLGGRSADDLTIRAEGLWRHTEAGGAACIAGGGHWRFDDAVFVELQPPLVVVLAPDGPEVRVVGALRTDVGEPCD